MLSMACGGAAALFVAAILDFKASGGSEFSSR
jgi:hypothetical protein